MTHEKLASAQQSRRRKRHQVHTVYDGCLRLVKYLKNSIKLFIYFHKMFHSKVKLGLFQTLSHIFLNCSPLGQQEGGSINLPQAKFLWWDLEVEK